jgi:hypothetical protein
MMSVMKNCCWLCVVGCALLVGWFAGVPCSLQAQIPQGLQPLRMDTARGNTADTLTLALRSAQPLVERVTLTGTLMLSNPTVFYPERLDAPSGITLAQALLQRQNDSMFTFSCVLQPSPTRVSSRDTLLLIRGEALAASDSICVVRLVNLRANGVPVAPAEGIIINQPFGASRTQPRFFVRFARLSASVPNPIARGQELTWVYQIDRPSDVTIVLYDVTGRELKRLAQGSQPLGVRSVRFAPLVGEFSPGLHWARLITNTGEAVQPFFISE